MVFQIFLKLSVLIINNIYPMNNKVIVCDLDGTLAPSKFPIEDSMVEVLDQVLKVSRLAVISGGAYPQYQKQFLSRLNFDKEILKNLFLFPANGTTSYEYDVENESWKKLYEENLTEEEKKQIFEGFKKALDDSDIDVSNPYGILIEDRGGEINFSGRGQEAPLFVKEVWDPDHTKRQRIVLELKKYIPQFEMRIGGMTSIEVTHPGITKAYAIKKIENLLRVSKEDIVFIGDAIFPGGNDFASKETGVECIQVSGPEETKKVLLKIINGVIV